MSNPANQPSHRPLRSRDKILEHTEAWEGWIRENRGIIPPKAMRAVLIACEADAISFMRRPVKD